MAIAPNEFGRSVVASGLASADDVKAFWQTLPAEAKAKGAEALSTSLVDAGKLTAYRGFQPALSLVGAQSGE